MSDSVRPPFLSDHFEDPTHPGRRPGSFPAIESQRPPPLALLAGIRIGLALGASRLFGRRMLLATLLGFAVVVAGAYIELHSSGSFAVDRSLRGTFGLVIPLVVFATVVEATGRKRLAEAVWPLARFGAPRRNVALGLAVAIVLAAAAMSALFAAAAVLAAFSASARPALLDALLSARIGALTGAAYAGWFTLGASFFERGRGAWIPLGVDFFLGGTSGFFAAVLPRGNASNLIGATVPFGLSQSSSSAVLLTSAVVLTAFAALRCRD